MADEKPESGVGASPAAEPPKAAAEAVGAGASVAEKKPAKSEPIVPQKREFHWYTPFGWAKDFIKGTVQGLGDGLSTGARRGLKWGILLGCAMFFAPVVPFIAAAGAGLGLPAVGAGFGAVMHVGFYALAGAAVGSAFAGAMGLATGGAYELKMRARREKYAEELAERNEMRAMQQQQAQQRGAGGSWRDYANLYNEYDRQRQLRWFVLEHNRMPASQGGWAERIENERAFAPPPHRGF